VNREGAEVTSAGTVFHTRAPATEKARCPTIGTVVNGVMTSVADWGSVMSVAAPCVQLFFSAGNGRLHNVL